MKILFHYSPAFPFISSQDPKRFSKNVSHQIEVYLMPSKRTKNEARKAKKKKNQQKNIRGGEKAKSKVKTAVSLLDPKTLSLLRRPNFHVSASLLRSRY